MVYIFSKSCIFYIKLLSFYAGGSGDISTYVYIRILCNVIATSSQRHRIETKPSQTLYINQSDLEVRFAVEITFTLLAHNVLA